MRHILIHWIKEKLGITALEQRHEKLIRQVKNQQDFIAIQTAELKKFTKVDADIEYQSNNTIILTGRYQNRGYVRFFDMGDGEFEKLTKQLCHMEKYAQVRHLDAPMNFHEKFDW